MAGLCITAAVVLLLTVLPLAAAGKASEVKPHSAEASNDAADYVGSDTCKTCHEDIYKAWEKTPHWKTTLNKAAGLSKQGCEGCHGPGKAHVEGGGDKAKIFMFGQVSPKEVSARCLTCHAGAHPNFERSPHGRANVSCTDCHSVHALKSGAGGRALNSEASGRALQSESNLLKVSQPQLCYSCHSDVKPAFAQPFHHRVNEGLITCSDCHDAHGSFKGKQLKATADQNAICTKCHAETRGPFVFEHPVIKAEGCTACHSPHGSPNARLLNVSNVNTLCLQCHSATNLKAFPNAVSEQGGPVHNQAAQYTPCTNCHSQIHGSNATYNFFR